MSSRPTGLKALMAQRNVLIALTRYLMQDRTGGVLGAAIEMLVQVLRAKGAMAYLLEGEELVLVAHNGLPRRAKAWLSHLPLNSEPWFVAQRVVTSRKKEVDTEIAPTRAGMGIRPVLEEKGWKALGAVPLQVSRDVLGVLVLATTSEGAFDRETMNMLEAVGGILALSLEREQTLAQGREEKARAAETAQLATMGLVASNVARELAAPVGALTLQLDEHQQDLRDLRRTLDKEGGDPVHVKALELLETRAGDIYDTVHKMQGLSSRLLSFSRETNPEPVDMGRVVERVLATVEGNLQSKNITLSIEGDDELVVKGREESLQMLVMQLVLYAAAECEGSSDAPEVVLTLSHADGWAVVDVAASGRSGAQTGARIYDAMVKGGRNAAVGLELAKQTAIMHGGRIETGTSKLGGVSITARLPMSAEVPAHPATPAPVGDVDDVENVVHAALEAAPTSGPMALDLDLQFPPGTSPSRPPPEPAPFKPGAGPNLELDVPGHEPPPADLGFGELDGLDDLEPPPQPRRKLAHGATSTLAGIGSLGTGEGARTRDDDDPFANEGGNDFFANEGAEDGFFPGEGGQQDDFFADEGGQQDDFFPDHAKDDGFSDEAFGNTFSDEPSTGDRAPAADDHGDPMVLWIDGDVDAAGAIAPQLTGYGVTIANGAEEARELIAGLRETPAMVLCAVSLPDGSGPDLHAEADFTLASRFVFLVGGVVTGEQAAYVQRSGCPTLIKPLTADEVTAILGVESGPPPAPESIIPETGDLDAEW